MTQIAVIETKSDIVKHNLNEMSKVRADMVQMPAVVNALSENQLMTARAGANTPIKALPKEVIRDKFEHLSVYIPKDVGITRWNDDKAMQYDRVRFYDIVTKYYSDLSVEEVKLAFELASVGELDQFLPQSNGRADRSHYQSFSVEYITKILNAFREHKKGTWKKATLALPEHTTELTHEEKTAYKNSFLLRIVEMFDTYKETGHLRNFPAPALITDELRKAGLIKEEKKPDKSHLSRAIHMVMADHMTTPYDKAKAREKGMDSEIVATRAYYFSRNEEIKAVFDKLIKEKKHLKDFLLK